MVAQTSTVPAVLDALKTLLEARRDGTPGSALVGVTVCTAPSGDDKLLESIQFYGTAEDSHQWRALGGRQREERYILDGDLGIIVKRGAGEEIAKTARDRAYAILAEIQTVIWDNPRLGLAARTDIQFATGGLEQGWQDNGRVAFIRFGISVVTVLER